MAITTAQKVDLLYKKLYGKTKTDGENIKSPSNESIPSPLLLRGDKVWTDSGLIPTTPPLASTSIVGVYKQGGTNPAVETTEDNTSTPKRTWLTNLTDWIPSEFSPLYQVLVFVDAPGSLTPQTTGVQIFPDGNGNNDAFWFDSQAGVLHFPDTNIPSTITGARRPYVVGFRYIGPFGVGSGSVVPATNLVLGVVRLDAPATNPADPIVLTPNGVVEGGAF